MPEFVNPYNFARVGQPSRRLPSITHERFEGISGRIRCTLTTETPFFTPDPEETWHRPLVEGGNPKDGHKLLGFFRLPDGTPAIPHTSLKGMLRSLCEALSNSCWAQFDPDYYAYRDLRNYAVFQRAGCRGIISESTSEPGFEIREVRECNFPRRGPPQWRSGLSEAALRKGLRVWIRSILLARTDTIVEIGLHRSELSDPVQATEGIVYPYWNGLFDLGDERPLRKRWRVVQYLGTAALDATAAAAHHRSREHFEAVVRSADVGPARDEVESVVRAWSDLDDAFVYFEREAFDDAAQPTGSVLSLGRSYRYKWSYRRGDRLHLLSILLGSPTGLGLSRCTTAANACMCCRMFGLLEDEESHVSGIAGKVSVGLARCTSLTPRFTPVKLAVLNGPKPSCRQFYLIPAANYSKGGVTPNAISATGYSWSDAVPRGRKFYWHQATRTREVGRVDTASYSASSQPVDDGSGRTTQELPLNSTVELLEPRATFDFTVDFENLSQAELGCLLLALDVAQQWTGTRHKLGMGKPLGLGTVHVEIRDGVEIDRVARYRSLMDTGEHPLQVEAYLEAFRTALEQANGGTPFQEMRNIADLRALLDASHALQEIRYPAGAAADEGFRWFQSHRDQPLCTVQDSDATSCRQST